MGELRLRVTDPAGLAVKGSVELVSEASQFRQTFVTDDSGMLIAQRLPFGMYLLQIRGEGFTPVSQKIEVNSVVPQELTVKLSIAGMNESVTVTDKDTLIDPDRVGTINEIGSQAIQDRPAALPGRSLQDLVNTQPGWLYEGNAVLHPRGSEYQTQFVVNGIPLTDNRSAGHGPEIEADNVESMSVYTSGIPAEYGRKMGGVIEVNTAQDTRPGFHGQIVVSGGSFDTASGYSMLQYQAGKNLFGVSADGALTSWYMNPPVPQNYTNTATLGDFSGSYERQFTPNDRLSLMFRHELSRFQIPNEQVQQAAGQAQDGSIFENFGAVSYQHIFSSDVVGNIRGMVRDNSNGLSSNPLSTPVIVSQQNHFTEGYFNASIAINHGIHSWKVGVESDNIFLNERFADIITDPAQFDPGTPATFGFAGNRPDLEQSAYVQDMIRLGNWTLSAGLRWDHYQLLVNQNALSPRLSLSRYFAKSELLVHASYDRVFQTPAFENILLSSSPTVVALNPDVLRLPVEPSHGNYYELGMTKGLFGKLSVDVNGYYRQVDNFADDDLLLNTPVSFPIAFRKASIYGAETKVNIPHWGKLSGFVSYSYMVGSAYFPVTGGLFLGESATNALTDLTGRFWVSQDQRNTVRARFLYQFVPRLWGAVGAQYGSGLPVDFDGTYQQALAQYGPEVISQVNLERNRVRPNFSLDTSIGADLWARDKVAMKVQFDVLNITDRFNLINFAGLFSGNSVAPPRTYGVRLQTTF
jgi:outer membrane cobalamin receptor